MTVREDFVSVVVPCYNSADTVSRTIASVRAQTHRAHEIIIVDDGSTDTSAAVIAELAGDDLRVITHPKNRGLSAARNSGTQAARGPFVAYVDADDEWYPTKLKRQLEHFARHPTTVVVACHADVRLLDGSTVRVNGDRELTVGPEAWRVLLRHSYFIPSEVLARTADVLAVGGFDEARYGVEDQDFLIRMSLRGPIEFVDEVLVLMHQQPGSLSSKNRAREADIVLPMVRHYLVVFDNCLSSFKKRRILGARYTQVGRNVYSNVPVRRLPILLRAATYGEAPLSNLAFIVTGCPWLEPLKRLLRRSA